MTGIKGDLQDVRIANGDPRLSFREKERGFRSVRGAHGLRDHERRLDLPHELGGQLHIAWYIRLAVIDHVDGAEVRIVRRPPIA